MVDVRGILRRFKPAGAPGAAIGAAVPADRTAEHDAELQPLFASLEDAEAEAHQLRARAAAEAADIRQEARRRAESIVEEAAERATLEQEKAERQARTAAEQSSAALLDQARSHAESLRVHAEPRVQEYVDRFVGEVADTLLGTSSRVQPPARGPGAPG
ncbi:hypothetical protein [Actinocrinis sp.]|uniref:hypothetical protein n=1 Tax=Actinocrinis sp. TaxID=1920516 RepID=UPI002D44BD9C|nr:hypothetical protein [Actinocrinis sp.]HZP51330.1 hypothetical protein [Actinocrinis sp.]